MEPKTGPKFLTEEVVFPAIRESYVDLLDAVKGADLLITHPAAPAGPLVGRKTGMPWVSTVLAPLFEHDPDAALDIWAARAQAWACGAMVDGLDCVEPQRADGKARDVYLYVISGHKVRNPAAAMALIRRLG